MGFDYAASGLPHNTKWEFAGAMCFDWLNQNMPRFKGEGILNFMRDQPVTAAQRLLQHVPNCSEDVVTLAMLGPARSSILPHIADPAVHGFVSNTFGARTLHLLLATLDKSHARGDQSLIDDVERLTLVEGLSTMTDQMIGREKKDAFHQKRLDILEQLEISFDQLKGKNPGLDALFADALVRSRASLDALDNPPPASGAKPPKGPV